MTKLDKIIADIDALLDYWVADDGVHDDIFNGVSMLKTLDEARDTLELLKAKYKPRESRKMLPCKCGCKRREHGYRFVGSNENSEGLICKKCGFEVWEKNATDVIRKWNEAVTQNDEA